MPHRPVLLDEVLAGLAVKHGDVVLDGTLGSGGHAREILERIGRDGRLIGIDQDPASLERCRMIFGEDSRVSLNLENFAHAEKVLDRLNIPQVDAVILDVGFSSEQIEDAGRGFSFEREGPLDMRMNPAAESSARDLINALSQEELERIFRDYGNERWARRFSEAVCREREHHSIETTSDLVRVIDKALPGGAKYPAGKRPGWAKRNPATRVFQALRIAVNRELEVLEDALPVLFGRLRTGGRMAVITFHSLEDRVVKRMFRQWKDARTAAWVTRKPAVPGQIEQIENPRSRSAKLRVVEKIL